MVKINGVFSEKEKTKIGAGNSRVREIAAAFEKKIMEIEIRGPENNFLEDDPDFNRLHLLEERRNIFAIIPERYGRCKICGKEIPLEQLRESPEISQCKNCRTL